MQLAKQDIINHVWYLGYLKHDDNTITIALHDRMHFRDSPHPETNEYFDLVEDDNRIVTQAVISNVPYKVNNPQHIFDYPKFHSLAEVAS